MQYPFEPYKIDARFGDPVAYGPHEGIDINGIGGGNTDCGLLLHPLADGEIYFTSTSSKGYGLMCILKFTVAGLTFYARYAHLQELLQKTGRIRRDQPIGKMGSTGNSTACHLHLDIFKKIPPPGQGWRWYPRSKELLEEYMVDPIALIKTYKSYTGEFPEEGDKYMELAQEFGCVDVEDLKRKIIEHVGTTWGNPDKEPSGHLGAERRKNKELERKVFESEQVAKDRMKEKEEAERHHQSDIESLAILLDLTVGEADLPRIKAEITALLGEADEKKKLREQLENFQVQKEKELGEIRAEYQMKVGDALKQIEDLKLQLTDMQRELKAVKTKADTLNWISTLINQLFQRR